MLRGNDCAAPNVCGTPRKTKNSSHRYRLYDSRPSQRIGGDSSSRPAIEPGRSIVEAIISGTSNASQIVGRPSKTRTTSR
jgi:hypothetical protein